MLVFMLVVERFHILWQRWPALNQLPKQIHEEVASLLLILPLEIAINICNADALVIPKASNKLVDHNRCEVYCHMQKG